jgi:hypothetical protein
MLELFEFAAAADVGDVAALTTLVVPRSSPTTATAARADLLGQRRFFTDESDRDTAFSKRK